MNAAFFLFSSVLIRIFWPKFKPDVHWICPVLALALPFCAGGFHIATSAVLSAFLALALFEQIHHHYTVQLYINRNSISFLLLFIAYCVTPFWAADKGMAGFALAKYLPVIAFILLVMQQDDIRQKTLDLLPACGCFMTAASALAACIPALRPYVTVNGRLAGFFQYPNSFAAFLLVALIVHIFCSRPKHQFLASLLLVIGIVLSGSKTVFVLMVLFMIAAVSVKGQSRLAMILGSALICGLAAGLLANALGLMSNADRFTDIRTSSDTFLVRLLYFRDVIPTILSHPFGIGYMGYPAIEGAIQTGRYYVSYIHNEFLQLLLEVGWISALFIAFSFLSALFSPKTDQMHRFILLAVLAHCMLDFDLQFSVFWIILLCCVNIRSGKLLPAFRSHIICFLSIALTAVSLWLGCGDYLYRSGKPESCLSVTPFHTEALTYQMSISTDPHDIDAIADQILSLNSTHSLAFSGKANVAFSQGDIASMIRYKENAIQSSRYTTEEYCDYFNKLCTAMQAYLQAGDAGSAAFCRKKLLEIPELMAAVSAQTHPLADIIGDDSALVLPPQYAEVLQQLQ